MRSRARLLVRIGGELFDALFQLDRDELAPGERASVGIWFLCPELLHDRVHPGEVYAVLEGTKEIGTLTIDTDVWRTERVVREGKEYEATVIEVGWTRATVELEGGWTASLDSRAVGLAPWSEIGAVLREGQRVRVEVEAVDPIRREVEISVVQGPGSR